MDKSQTVHCATQGCTSSEELPPIDESKVVLCKAVTQKELIEHTNKIWREVLRKNGME